MSVISASDSSTHQPRVRRKPAPSLELDARYPTPDPHDPFAPLSVLRNRTASTLSSTGAPLSFRGNSTSCLPTLPYTGGRYPPDIYQAYLDSISVTPSISSGKNLGVVTASSFTRSTSNITQESEHSYGRGPEEESPWPPQWQDWTPDTRESRHPIQRRRSRSAMSRKEARLTVPIPPRNSPYGHSKLQSYVLANARSSVPALTNEPQPISPAASVSGSSHSLVSRVDSDIATYPIPSSPLGQTSISADGVPVASSSKAKKLSRLLPKKLGSRLDLSHQSTNDLTLIQTNASYTSFPHLSIDKSTKAKHISEENTFHARRKSTTLFPAELAANLHTMEVSSPIRDSITGYVYEPFTNAERRETSDIGSASLQSHTSYGSYSVSPAARTPTHTRSATITDGLSFDLALNTPAKPENAQSPTSPPPPSFDENGIPTYRQLMEAAASFVVAENGLRVPFGDLFRDQKTIVIFIRHFWCPLCQDYLFSVAGSVNPKLLKEADVNLVVIGNGSYNMIKSYRQIFRTPFAFYTDPSLRLHKLLGMNLRITELKAQRKRGGYVRHGPVSGIAMVFKNALRVGMPIWEKGGDFAQLGGEFILGPGLTASYAHRMPDARSHAPIVHVLAAAGVGLQCEKLSPVMETAVKAAPAAVDEEQWMEERRLSLARIRERKVARRMGVAFPTCQEIEDSQVVLPKIEPPGKLTRSDSIEEEEQEEERQQSAASQGLMLMGDSRMKTESQTSSQPPDSDEGSQPSSVANSNDGETETLSVDSRPLFESDSGSDRTRAEEAEPLTLQDKVVTLDLEDPIPVEVVGL